MSHQKTLDDIDWNELAFIGIENGKMSVWSGWRRAISAFNDPSMWRSTENWGNYFQRLPDHEWGPAGYGIVLMDLDARKSFSINDWSSPESVYFPPIDSAGRSDDGPSEGALLKLLGEPGEWKNVTIQAFKVNEKGRSPDNKTHTFSMDQALPPDADPDTARQTLAMPITGASRLNNGNHLILRTTYTPEGWIDPLPISMPDWEKIMWMLEHARGAGLPPPRWDLIDRAFEKMDIPTDESAIRELDEDHAWADPEPREAAMKLIEIKRAWNITTQPKPGKP